MVRGQRSSCVCRACIQGAECASALFEVFVADVFDSLEETREKDSKIDSSAENKCFEIPFEVGSECQKEELV